MANSTQDFLPRRHNVPVIFVKGTHYEVGFDVGRTFKGLIQNLLKIHPSLNNDYIPCYETQRGKAVYESCLEAVRSRYPQYLDEIRGTADGAEVPFYKLFLFQMDDILPNVAKNITTNNNATGCSSVCLNEAGNLILGHTEDALVEVVNHYYIVCAHIIPDGPTGVLDGKEEKFMSLCYAGNLPGYTMGNNHHGLVYSINTLSVRKCMAARIPRSILTRALLTADSKEMVNKILTDHGCGTADGCSINLGFHNDPNKILYNIEMAPHPNDARSQLDITKIRKGEDPLIHCNMYLRLKVAEVDGLIIQSSKERLAVLCDKYKPKTKEDVKKMLSDQTAENYWVFQDKNSTNVIQTIAAGIFDFEEKTWSLYSDRPALNDPITTLPLIPLTSGKCID